MGNELKPLIEQYTGRQSKWNGRIELTNGGAQSGGKLWDCSIRLNSDAPEHVLLHELIHSCSVSHYGAKSYVAYKWEEELAVHYLSQELALLKKLSVVNSGYDEGVELIREFRAALGIGKLDLEFASELVKQPLGERWDWLWGQISDKMNSGATMELGQELIMKLEAIRQWKAL